MTAALASAAAAHETTSSNITSLILGILAASQNTSTRPHFPSACLSSEAAPSTDSSERRPAAPEASGLFDAAAAYLVGQTADALEHLLIAVTVYAIVCLLCYKLFHQRSAKPRAAANPALAASQQSDDDDRTTGDHSGRTASRAFRFPRVRRVLLVTAHPDDECMFFGPTLLALGRRRNCTVYVLCLSNGDHSGQGETRRDELWRACERLRISPSNIMLLHASELRDDPQCVWRSELVAQHIQQQVEALDIDAVCTFDRDGVSRHPNHRAIFYATASLFLAGQLPKRCRVLTLDTTNVLRKYAFVFDLLLTLVLGSPYWCVASWADVRCVRRAMAEHRSQMVWFRRLYVLCSRYMIINSWRELSVSDVELEMQIDDS